MNLKTIPKKIKNRIKKVIYILRYSNRKSDEWRKNEVNKYLNSHEIAKLQIGCGPFPMEDGLIPTSGQIYMMEVPCIWMLASLFLFLTPHLILFTLNIFLNI